MRRKTYALYILSYVTSHVRTDILPQVFNRCSHVASLAARTHVLLLPLSIMCVMCIVREHDCTHLKGSRYDIFETGFAKIFPSVYEAQDNLRRKQIDELRTTRAYPASPSPLWLALLLRLFPEFLPLELLTKPCVEREMPPKKDLRALLMDLRVHMQWIAENLQTLRSRAGVGLRGK